MAYNLLQTLKSIRKDYYSVTDLENVSGMDRKSLLVTLNRLAKRGSIIRLFRGMYQLPDQPANIPAIATQIYPPAYISFEWALSKYGILSQVPYTVTLATPGKPKKVVIGNIPCEYRRLKPDLFWGFSLQEGVYLAEPEKALLDQLYLVSLGKASLDLDSLDLKEIRRTVLRNYMKKYPAATRSLAQGIV